MYDHRHWMKIALKEAKKSEEKNEVPVGAVIIKNNILIAKGHNSCIGDKDPTAHAEIVALRKAGSFLNNYRLNSCDIYVTSETCVMCFGAIVQARIKKIYFATLQHKSGVLISHLRLHNESFLNHKVEISFGVLEEEARYQIKNFFRNKRIYT